ncbi:MULTISPECIES: helix-turn-helix domain-containing protein [unclassified Spirosoma]|uniref:helix-turn-helix domain-containing protein n=1 Tax=unclassified Spirosoma TaxID=2621999 RepID=UPI00095DE784|nr:MULTISPECIES: helix-turn-helix domain-containing protein [unclassified Spirosoma]MBN8821543.1 helix-turn-helix domain-containing protein [Spirosoma sp.]OJW78319.1 MAG: transcriptional regulator [Spirosoma sp. 48-14]
MSLVSDNIRYLRKLNGLTQEQFSRKINIKRSLLGAYEEGRANPNQQNMQAIARAFNTTVELLTRQDLRKIRETPNLSIPLGQASKPIDSRPSTIRTDGKLDADENDPFQHPDFPDIFAQPASSAPEPQPLSSVLNKYYKTQEEPRRAIDHTVPGPPVITSPIRPDQSRQPAAFQSVQPSARPVSLPAQPSVDELFGQPSGPRPAMPASRPEEPLTFNNVYKESFGSAQPTAAPQALAPSIPVVMQRLFGEYKQRYQQPDFIYRLPAMHLPTLPEGHYRAFEAGDDFVFPGALLVGRFIRNWFDIADGKQYVLLVAQPSTGAGICCRRVYNQVKIKGTLLLTADRADIPNQEIALKDVLEVWEICAFVSQTMPPPPPNTDRLRQLIDEIRFEVERL